MTREQIIKALECCIEAQCENCCNLGSWHEQWNCMTGIMRKALSLVKELTEENERLREENDELCDNIACLEIDKENAERRTVRQMKERIKEEAKSIYLLSDPPKIMLKIREDVLDQIAKEMVENG